MGRDAPGVDCLGELWGCVPLLPLSQSFIVAFIDRGSIGMARRRPTHSQLSLLSRAFYPAPVLEGGPSGASVRIRASSSWATRMADKARGTWQVDGPIACVRVSAFVLKVRILNLMSRSSPQVVPAAGYIKSQAYVSWCMSRFAHFVDPALGAVLDSSLTPDDNDLFLGNLVGKPVLALHG